MSLFMHRCSIIFVFVASGSYACDRGLKQQTSHGRTVHYWLPGCNCAMTRDGLLNITDRHPDGWIDSTGRRRSVLILSLSKLEQIRVVYAEKTFFAVRRSNTVASRFRQHDFHHIFLSSKIMAKLFFRKITLTRDGYITFFNMSALELCRTLLHSEK